MRNGAAAPTDSMAKREPPPRPSPDFIITSVEWELANEETHSDAGFPKIPEETVRRRYRQFLDVLNRSGWLTKGAYEAASSTLFSGHLTEDGFRFCQEYFGKWIDRMHKDKGAEKEERLLEKWRQSFLDS